MAKKKNVQAINYAMDKKQQLQKKHTHSPSARELATASGTRRKKFLDWNNAWHEATSESGKYARPKTN